MVVKGLNKDDIVPIVRFARERNLEARFIEFMPLDGQELWSLKEVLTADEMIARLEQEWGPLTAVPMRTRGRPPLPIASLMDIRWVSSRL